jgi:hypothetical protein
MAVETIYTSRHFGLASALRYILGDSAHRETWVENGTKRISYAFRNTNGECEKLAAVFFSDAGMATGNARDLIEAAREVKKTMTAAINTDGEQIWRNPNV